MGALWGSGAKVPEHPEQEALSARGSSSPDHTEHPRARQAYVVYRCTHGKALEASHVQLMNTLDTFKVTT